jgi:hypothetical protein
MRATRSITHEFSAKARALFENWRQYNLQDLVNEFISISMPVIQSGVSQELGAFVPGAMDLSLSGMYSKYIAAASERISFRLSEDAVVAEGVCQAVMIETDGTQTFDITDLPDGAMVSGFEDEDVLLPATYLLLIEYFGGRVWLHMDSAFVEKTS